jgi:sirohydrochlorin cobaltochelatase
MREAVILIGHGRTASDTPRELVTEFRSLERQRKETSVPASPRLLELEGKIRQWPRTPETDPYKFGLETILAEAAYNEFCAPSIEEAISTLAGDGIRDIALIPTMFTPGGAHAEKDIPEVIERMRLAYPEVHFRYAWPFPVANIVRLLKDTLAQSCQEEHS